MTVRAAWLLPGGSAPGQTREDTRLAPLGTMTPADEMTTRQGIVPGGDPFAVTGAGAMSLQVGVGRATVQGTLAQGAYPVAVDAPEVLTFSDGNAQFARVDTVVLRVFDGLFDTSGQTLAHVEVVEGAPSATPTAPTLEPACLPLWDVRVPAGASAGVGGIDWDSALTDRRRYTVAVGGILPHGALSDVGAYDGQYADIGGVLYRWSAADAAWEPYQEPTTRVLLDWTSLASIGAFQTGFSASTTQPPRLRKILDLGTEVWEFEGNIEAPNAAIHSVLHVFTFAAGHRVAASRTLDLPGNSINYQRWWGQLSSDGRLLAGLPSDASSSTATHISLTGLRITNPAQ
ncbi:hypothetical protein [Streptomyces pseudogriseolus]|uniref:hypothetical protein n=1 Tax=Streptomyces pseudogriseolus TaxID=36817 RepID=UPI003FA30D51